MSRMQGLREALDRAEDTDRSDATGLSDAVRIRLDAETLGRLNRVVAFAQGRGRREVNRSYLIRDALDAYLAEVEREFPEIRDMAVTSA